MQFTNFGQMQIKMVRYSPYKIAFVFPKIWVCHDIGADKFVKTIGTQFIYKGMLPIVGHKSSKRRQVGIEPIFLINIFDDDIFVYVVFFCEFLGQILRHLVIQITSNELLSKPCSRTLVTQDIT